MIVLFKRVLKMWPNCVVVVFLSTGIATVSMRMSTSTSSTHAPILWSYDDDSSWPGQKCQTGGRRQSPINIQTSKAVMDYEGAYIQHGPLKFVGYRKVLLTGFNNGRTIQFSSEGHISMHAYMSGGPLRTTYRLEQFHFHRLSEHAVDGQKFAIEIHFVHILANLSVSQAMKEREGVAIVSVFCNVTNNVTAQQLLVMDEILEHIPNLPTRGSRLSGLLLDVAKLLSIDQTSYYAYEGSLTSPECNEVVTWIIFSHPLYISQAQFQILSTINGGNYNFRMLQPTTRRHRVYGSVPMVSQRTEEKPAIVSWFNAIYQALSDMFSNLRSTINRKLRRY